MPSYVFSFRAQMGRKPSAEEESAWMRWFESIGSSIVDFGHRVGPGPVLGAPGRGSDELSGYVVVTAETLDAAATLAAGCPGLAQGGAVEIGETIES